MKLSELSQSEKRLMGIVAFLVVVLLNVVVFQFFNKTRNQLSSQYTQKTGLAASLRSWSPALRCGSAGRSGY